MTAAKDIIVMEVTAMLAIHLVGSAWDQKTRTAHSAEIPSTPYRSPRSWEESRMGVVGLGAGSAFMWTLQEYVRNATRHAEVVSGRTLSIAQTALLPMSCTMGHVYHNALKDSMARMQLVMPATRPARSAAGLLMRIV